MKFKKLLGILSIGMSLSLTSVCGPCMDFAGTGTAHAAELADAVEDVSGASDTEEASASNEDTATASETSSASGSDTSDDTESVEAEDNSDATEAESSASEEASHLLEAEDLSQTDEADLLDEDYSFSDEELEKLLKQMEELESQNDPTGRSETESQQDIAIQGIDGSDGVEELIRYLQEIVFKSASDGDEEIKLDSAKEEWVNMGRKDRVYYDTLNNDAEKAMYDLFELEAQIYMDDPDFVRLMTLEGIDTTQYKFKINAKKAGGSALIPIPLSGLDMYNGQSISYKRAKSIYYMFLQDNPQYYFMFNGTSELKDASGTTVGISTYIYDAFSAELNNGKYATIDAPADYSADGMRMDSFNQLKAHVEDACREIKSSSAWRSGSTPSRLRAVHDWLIEHVDYDYFAFGYVSKSALDSSDYSSYYSKFAQRDGSKLELNDSGNPIGSEDLSLSQSLFSVFGREITGDQYPIFYKDVVKNIWRPRYYGSPRKDLFTGESISHYTICQGYTVGFSMLCRYLGLSAINVFSKNHCWNIVKLEGISGYRDGWYQIDSTWDDEGGKHPDEATPLGISYENFLLPYSGEFKTDHKFDDDCSTLTRDLNIVTSLSSSLMPVIHYYSGKDNYSNVYFLKGITGGRFALYPATGRGNHTASKSAYYGTTSQLTKLISEGEVVKFYDTPGYLKHTDTVKKGSSSSSSNYSSSSSSTSTTYSTTTTSSSDDDKDKTKSKKTFEIGKGKNKAYYTKAKKKRAHYSYTAAGSKTKEITVPDTVKIKKKTRKVAIIDSYAFADMKKLERVNLGKNIEVIQSEAFDGCKRLRELVVPSTKLKAKKCKGCLTGSGIRRVYVPKEKLAAYKKIFRKSKVQVVAEEESTTTQAAQ